MKRISLILLLSTLWCLTSCERKQLPEPVIEEPDFKLNGTINGNPFSMIAGENNMQADAHVFQDAFGVFHYESALETSNCSDCSGALRIHCTSTQAYSNGETPTEFADIYSGGKPLLTSEPAQNFMGIQLSASALNPGEFFWMIDGFQNFTTPVLEYEFDIPGLHQVILQTTLPSACEVIIAQTIFAGSPEPCAVPFEVIDLGGNVFQAAINQDMPEGLTLIAWNFDGAIVEGNQTTMAAPLAPLSPHFIEAYFVNAQGTSGSYSFSWFSDGIGDCVQSFDWNYLSPAPELNRISVSYVSPDGKSYSSITDMNNDPSSFFQFNDIAAYDLSIDELPTRMVNLEFSLYLVNEDDPTDILWMENVIGDMVFVLPE